MSSYIFRKYPGYNPNQIEGWTESTGIDPTNFNPENIAFGRGSSKAGTSIPSPLARLELFDTAFQILGSDRGNLDGNTIYHQLVSDSLDVFQLLFNSKQADIGSQSKIWFKEWRAQENIERLNQKGRNHPHNLLARSLEQVFQEPGGGRFTDTDSLFLIFYENRLLGGTSPLTFFFTTPNWSRHIKNNEIRNIPQSTDGRLFFSQEYRPLHQRDTEFVAYLYKLSLHFKDAFSKAEGFRKYLHKTVAQHFPDFKHQFAKYHAGEHSIDDDYTKLITNVERKLLTVNGLFFYQQKEEKEKEKIRSVSDFIIRATQTKYQTQYNQQREPQEVEAPLVLVEGMNIPGDYMEKNIAWNSSTKIKNFFYQGIPLFERKLPIGNSLTTVTYPFITTSDFLEDNLAEMPFYLNKAKFFTGFKGDFKYLLPIKKEYFNFFSLSDLKRNLEIELQDGQVTVRLKVPIINKKGVSEIVFTKKYEKGKSIVEYRTGLGIFPFYQINDSQSDLSELNDYTILLAERNDMMKFKSLDFYSFKKPTALPSSFEVRTKAGSTDTINLNVTSRFFKVEEAFDFMELSYKDPAELDTSGLIIPNFETLSFNKDNLSKAFTFALDFGTSNTHIAWMQNNEAVPKPFSIDEADQQMVLLNAPVQTENGRNQYDSYGAAAWMDIILRREFVPAMIGPGQPISFPFKTATCETIAFNTPKEKQLFNQINIGYYIDQEENQAHTIKYTTNLKWLLENSNDHANMSRVQLFLTQLMHQIKTKTILNYGNPDELTIVWSIPLSMSRGMKTQLKGILGKAFASVFKNTKAKLSDPIPESVAPYFSLTKSDTDIQNTANVINVDIGGGTTDIMMFMESTGSREDKYLTTSFRFAGTDLWGNGHENRMKDNGFILNYQQYKKANNLDPIETRYYNKVKEDSNLSADDLISLLFRYEGFKFQDSITVGNPELLILPYLHYSAIIYHLVQLIEIKDYPLPRYLSFTGKGSQYIKLLGGGDEQEVQDFTKLLIKAYTKKSLLPGFKIHLDENPKEITANGSILYAKARDDEKARYSGQMAFIHPGFDPEKYPELKSQLLDDSHQFHISETKQIDSPLNIAVLENLNDFLDKTLGNKEITKYLQEFKINGSKQALDLMKWQLNIHEDEGFIYDSYKKVLEDLHRQDEENEIPESLFFFALKDALYRLSKHIVLSKSFQ
ncbi:hypothetical protein [Dyadobacter tibetensis]|uniref:hypothetical protein n=1 Tax=Dyadobacter tibetensis TaxID=1211851 RepID=UPI00046FFFB6|nr:hypothetical protein [Dyadobacter tibetensis]